MKAVKKSKVRRPGSGNRPATETKLKILQALKELLAEKLKVLFGDSGVEMERIAQLAELSSPIVRGMICLSADYKKTVPSLWALYSSCIVLGVEVQDILPSSEEVLEKAGLKRKTTELYQVVCED